MDKTGNAPDTHETRMVGQGVPFERIRRIALLSMPVSPAAPDNGHGALHRRSVATGYLVGRLERFNGAKKKEVADRVVHGFRR